jgi:hypothetical protein
MTIPRYMDATPVATLLDGTTDLDTLNSRYVNMRFLVQLDRVITIDSKYEANLPGLANDYYGDQEYWRAIMWFNGMSDPLTDLCVGSQIGMPNKSSLDAFFARTTGSQAQPVTL